MEHITLAIIINSLVIFYNNKKNDAIRVRFVSLLSAFGFWMGFANYLFAKKSGRK